MSARSSALYLRNLQLRQRLQELLGSHRDGDQALDQVHDRVGAAGQVLWSGVIVLCPSGWVMR